ncbi:MAG TPA: 16S rRNA (uracil(1498)-N(3))-methyltransferase [Nitrospinaceae bacterium]|nr:16S rRNA (uracil(1498)-N(3))-methyltransferase [Nitrospinaceae bacterium]
MHRFFTAPENISDEKAVLCGTDVAHIRTVLRLKGGDRVQVLDGLGNCYTVILSRVGRDKIESRIESKEDVEDCESPLTVSLGQGMVKGTGFDGIVRRAVELGVGHVSPVSAKRCIAKLSKEDSAKKIGRWQRIAREASKQCGRARVPEVGPRALSVRDFCFAHREFDLRLIFWEEERSVCIGDLPVKTRVKSAAVLIGPEGGFAAEEIESAMEYGFQSVSLGPRLLRTGTAPLAVLSILQHLWGDL